MPDRQPFDTAAYLKGIRTRPCFICGLAAGDPAFAHHVVYEDEFAIAFLNKFPALVGHLLVAPKVHLEQAAGDFDLAGYLRLQTVVHRMAEALRAVLEVERVYILSLGSQQANRHVHWHVAPLPPGVPLKAQQFAALDVERAGVVAMDDAEMAALAGRIAQAIPPVQSGPPTLRRP